MKSGLRVLLRTLLVIGAVVLLALTTLAVLWLSRRADPISFLSDHYVVYVQVPSLRSVYDQWLNLEAADAVLGRPELAPYRRLLTDTRGLALTDSAVVRALLDVHADVMLMDDHTFLAAVDLGWRGMLGPLVRVVGPLLGIKGFSVVSGAGVPMYRFSSGPTTILAAIIGNVGLVTVDAAGMREALLRHSSHTGLDWTVSPEVLGLMKLRSATAVRIMVDTSVLTRDLFAAGSLGAKVLAGIEMPGKSMLDVEMSGGSLRLALQLPVTVRLKELASVLAFSPAPIGVLGMVPANASLVSVLNMAPLASLYRLVASLQVKDVQQKYAKADSDARSGLGVGIDELLFSWVGAEVGAFMLSGSPYAVFFARITDEAAYRRAMDKLTGGGSAGTGKPVVLEGVRIERIWFPWYIELVLALMGVEIPEASFIARGGYFFLSMDPANLSAVAASSKKGHSLAPFDRYTALTRATRVNASVFAWYDAGRATPFFMRGAGALVDVLRLYATGAVSVHVSSTVIRIDLVAERGTGGGVQLMHGFPVKPRGALSGDLAAFRFKSAGSASLAWIADRSVLVLADAGGQETARATLEKDSVLVPGAAADGLVGDLWAVSPAGTVYRFGPGLVPLAPFPIATGGARGTGSMRPGLLEGKLALFSLADGSLRLFGADGEQGDARARIDGSLTMPPDAYGGMLAYASRSFRPKVHLVRANGTEAPGWPVQALGTSLGAPRLLARDGSMVVVFLTRAGTLHAWDSAGAPLPGFPFSLPGTYNVALEPVLADGQAALVALAQDGRMSMVAMDGTVLRWTHVPGLDGRYARMLVADLRGDGKALVFLYGAGAFIAGYDQAFRPLPGFPVRGASRPQLVDIDQDGRQDLVTAGLDGKIYAYSVGQRKP